MKLDIELIKTYKSGIGNGNIMLEFEFGIRVLKSLGNFIEPDFKRPFHFVIAKIAQVIQRSQK